MATYHVTQKMLSLGPTYYVTAVGSEEALFTVKGKLLSATPKLTMVQGTDGAEVATLTGNFTRTQFTVTVGGAEQATLRFPLISWKKGFGLAAGGREYSADGGVLALGFSILGADGKPALAITKMPKLRDQFEVEFSAELERDTALLAAVAVDQKYFQEDTL